MIDGIIQVIMGTIGTLGFSILFNVRGKRLVFATLGGCISWAWYLIFNGIVNNEVLSYFVSAALITVYCEIMARIIKTPTTSFILPSLVPLIPGASLYYTMRMAFLGSFGDFTDKAVYTLKLAAALAIGVIIASAVSKTAFPIYYKLKAKIKKA